jgi:hypothetical protein
MDLVDLKDEIKLFNETTLPRLEAMVHELVKALNDAVARLDGAQITITVSLSKIASIKGDK